MLIALDFETANAKPESACAIGFVVAEAGGVLTHREILLRPSRRFASFSRANIAIHGIYPAMVAGAPEWPEVWRELSGFLAGGDVLAHNTLFDMHVLQALNQEYGLVTPDFDFLCTWRLARKLWPQLTSYRLNALCARIGFQFRHHRASEDAMACLRLYEALCRESGSSGFETVAAAAGLQLGQWRQGVMRSSCRKSVNGE